MVPPLGVCMHHATGMSINSLPSHFIYELHYGHIYLPHVYRVLKFIESTCLKGRVGHRAPDSYPGPWMAPPAKSYEA